MSAGQTEQGLEKRVEKMLRTTAETIERKDREAGERQVAEFWHEDCEWVPLLAGVEGEATYRGHEGVLKFFEDFMGTFDVRYRGYDFRQIGNAVVWLTAMELRGRGSGIQVERELGVVYEFDGELIRHGRAYDSHAAALAAAEELAHA